MYDSHFHDQFVCCMYPADAESMSGEHKNGFARLHPAEDGECAKHFVHSFLLSYTIPRERIIPLCREAFASLEERVAAEKKGAPRGAPGMHD